MSIKTETVTYAFSFQFVTRSESYLYVIGFTAEDTALYVHTLPTADKYKCSITARMSFKKSRLSRMFLNTDITYWMEKMGKQNSEYCDLTAFSMDLKEDIV